MSSREAKDLQFGLKKSESNIFMDSIMEKEKRKCRGKSRPTGGKKRNGGKGKGLLDKKCDRRYQQRKKEEERQALRESLRRSCNEAGIAMTRGNYRAVVDVSDDSEEEYLDGIVDQLMEDCPPESPVDDDGEADEDFQSSEEQEGEFDDVESVEDEVDSPEEAMEVLTTSTGRKKRPRKVYVPDSDNDPDPPGADDHHYAPDEFGWSRTLRRVKAQRFKGPTPTGPTFRRHRTPAKYFLAFFPLAVLSLIAEWTNINLRDGGCKILLSVAELRAWFGIRIVMGLVKIPYYQDYWSNSPGYYNRLIATTMTRSRFDQITQHLACAIQQRTPTHIPTETLPCLLTKKHHYSYMRKHPLYPLQPVWDAVLAKCKVNYNLSKNLAIDEAMVKYSGFKAKVRKFFMPLKPIRSGFKIYALAESSTGYMANFMVHPFQTGKPAKMVDIAMSVASPFVGVHHHIYTDKLYTSVELARRLLAANTYLTGAVKSTSKGLPTDFSKNSEKNPRHFRKLKALNKMPRGTFYSRQADQLTAVAWKDSRVMTMLSSAHQGYRNRITDKLTRKVKDESGQRVSSSVAAPSQAVDYTRNMGGVDRGDQLRAYYTCSRKSQYWWRKLLYFLVDIAQTNAWVAYKSHHAATEGTTTTTTSEDDLGRKTGRMSHSAFVMEVGTGLIKGYSKGSTPRQSSTRPLSSASHHASPSQTEDAGEIRQAV